MEVADVRAQQYPGVEIEDYHSAVEAGNRGCCAFLRKVDSVTERDPTTSLELFVSSVLLALWVEIRCQGQITREARSIVREDKQNDSRRGLT